MDPLALTTVATAGSALALLGMAVRWRAHAHRAEAEIGALRERLEAAQHAATHDPLTGLPNRRAFFQMGEDFLAEHRHIPRTVALVDLDGFKLINDHLGHAAGDEVLVTIAQRFAAYAGQDLVARLGGDEFVGLLAGPIVDSHTHYALSRRLAESLSAPMRVHGHVVAVTASVGLALLEQDLADAVCRADAAMYRVKARNHAIDDDANGCATRRTSRTFRGLPAFTSRAS